MGRIENGIKTLKKDFDVQMNNRNRQYTSTNYEDQHQDILEGSSISAINPLPAADLGTS